MEKKIQQKKPTYEQRIKTLEEDNTFLKREYVEILVLLNALATRVYNLDKEVHEKETRPIIIDAARAAKR